MVNTNVVSIAGGEDIADGEEPQLRGDKGFRVSRRQQTAAKHHLQYMKEINHTCKILSREISYEWNEKTREPRLGHPSIEEE